MSTKQPLRIISPEPRLALALANRKKILLPDEIYEYLTNWIQEVGATMRSHDFIVASMASYASSGMITVLANRLRESGRLELISGLLGFPKK